MKKINILKSVFTSLLICVLFMGMGINVYADIVLGVTYNEENDKYKIDINKYGDSQNVDIQRWVTNLNAPNSYIADTEHITKTRKAYENILNKHFHELTISQYKEYIAQRYSDYEYIESESDYFVDNFGNRLYVWKIAPYQAGFDIQFPHASFGDIGYGYDNELNIGMGTLLFLHRIPTQMTVFEDSRYHWFYSKDTAFKYKVYGKSNLISVDSVDSLPENMKNGNGDVEYTIGTRPYTDTLVSLVNHNITYQGNSYTLGYTTTPHVLGFEGDSENYAGNRKANLYEDNYMAIAIMDETNSQPVPVLINLGTGETPFYNVKGLKLPDSQENYISYDKNGNEVPNFFDNNYWTFNIGVNSHGKKAQPFVKLEDIKKSDDYADGKATLNELDNKEVHIAKNSDEKYLLNEYSFDLPYPDGGVTNIKIGKRDFLLKAIKQMRYPFLVSTREMALDETITQRNASVQFMSGLFANYAQAYNGSHGTLGEYGTTYVGYDENRVKIPPMGYVMIGSSQSKLYPNTKENLVESPLNTKFYGNDTNLLGRAILFTLYGNPGKENDNIGDFSDRLNSKPADNSKIGKIIMYAPYATYRPSWSNGNSNNSTTMSFKTSSLELLRDLNQRNTGLIGVDNNHDTTIYEESKNKTKINQNGDTVGYVRLPKKVYSRAIVTTIKTFEIDGEKFTGFINMYRTDSEYPTNAQYVYGYHSFYSLGRYTSNYKAVKTDGELEVNGHVIENNLVDINKNIENKGEFANNENLNLAAFSWDKQDDFGNWRVVGITPSGLGNYSYFPGESRDLEAGITYAQDSRSASNYIRYPWSSYVGTSGGKQEPLNFFYNKMYLERFADKVKMIGNSEEKNPGIFVNNIMRSITKGTDAEKYEVIDGYYEQVLDSFSKYVLQDFQIYQDISALVDRSKFYVKSRNLNTDFDKKNYPDFNQHSINDGEGQFVPRYYNLDLRGVTLAKTETNVEAMDDIFNSLDTEFCRMLTAEEASSGTPGAVYDEKLGYYTYDPSCDVKNKDEAASRPISGFNAPGDFNSTPASKITFNGEHLFKNTYLALENAWNKKIPSEFLNKYAQDVDISYKEYLCYVFCQYFSFDQLVSDYYNGRMTTYRSDNRNSSNQLNIRSWYSTHTIYANETSNVYVYNEENRLNELLKYADGKPMTTYLRNLTSYMEGDGNSADIVIVTDSNSRDGKTNEPTFELVKEQTFKGKYGPELFLIDTVTGKYSSAKSTATTCPRGYSFNDGVCIKIDYTEKNPICDYPYQYDRGLKMCTHVTIVAAECDPGYILVNGFCVRYVGTSPICNDTEYYDQNIGACVSMKDGTCPAGQVPDVENAQCIEETAKGCPWGGELINGHCVVKKEDYTSVFGDKSQYVFDYTGRTESVVLPKGRYILEVWGAQGGNNGGKGGYSTGTLELNKDTTIFVTVGQQGVSVSNGRSSTNMFNGGGKAASAPTNFTAGAGGGATDIKIGTDDLNYRVIVAGGGGGSVTIQGTTFAGGAGAGEGPGGDGVSNTDYSISGDNQGYGGELGSAGSNVGYPGAGGSWAIGGNAVDYMAGGGGGWFGGAAGQAAGGGSGYIFTEGSYVPNDYKLDKSYKLTNVSGTAGSRSGNGYAVITSISQSEPTCEHVVLNPGETVEVKHTYIGKENEFAYKKECETFFAPVDGTYLIEGWGAQGGASYYNAEGGRGGYTSGLVDLKSGDQLQICVGGQGGRGNNSTVPSAGGFNGGGQGNGVGGAGGGMTSIKLIKNNKVETLLVAGGGGGAGVGSTYSEEIADGTYKSQMLDDMSSQGNGTDYNSAVIQYATAGQRINFKMGKFSNNATATMRWYVVYSPTKPTLGRNWASNLAALQQLDTGTKSLSSIPNRWSSKFSNLVTVSSIIADKDGYYTIYTNDPGARTSSRSKYDVVTGSEVYTINVYTDSDGNGGVGGGTVGGDSVATKSNAGVSAYGGSSTRSAGRGQGGNSAQGGGGGGGYYAGFGSSRAGGGGGGSGYVGALLKNGVTVDGTRTFKKTNSTYNKRTSEVGHSGNGYAKVTLYETRNFNQGKDTGVMASGLDGNASKWIKGEPEKTAYYCQINNANNNRCDNSKPVYNDKLDSGSGLAIGSSKTFNYTGNVQQIKLEPGTYKIEVWGAAGGDGVSGKQTSASHGGLGGYSVGELKVTTPTTYNIFVGGKGYPANNGTNKGAGWNGGGGAQQNTNGALGYGGGGMTHISTTNNPATTTWNSAGTIIVAGGGGGADDASGRTIAQGDLVTEKKTAVNTSNSAELYCADTNHSWANSGTSAYGNGLKIGIEGSAGYTLVQSTVDLTNATTLSFSYRQGQWSQGGDSSTSVSGYIEVGYGKAGDTSFTSLWKKVSTDRWWPDTYETATVDIKSIPAGNVLKFRTTKVGSNYRWISHWTNINVTTQTVTKAGYNDGSGGFGGGATGGEAYINGVLTTGTAGTQTSGNAQGVGGSATTVTDTAGAGGGWWGGKPTNNNNGGGGGGSGYVNTTVLTNASTKAGNTAFPNVAGTGNETGHAGNGAAKITRLSAEGALCSENAEAAEARAKYDKACALGYTDIGPDLCERRTTIQCPTGYTWNIVHQMCVRSTKPLGCTSNGTLINKNNTVYSSTNWVCGYKEESLCPDGYKKFGGACMIDPVPMKAPRMCPNGYEEFGDRCRKVTTINLKVGETTSDPEKAIPLTGENLIVELGQTYAYRNYLGYTPSTSKAYALRNGKLTTSVFYPQVVTTIWLFKNELPTTGCLRDGSCESNAITAEDAAMQVPITLGDVVVSGNESFFKDIAIDKNTKDFFRENKAASYPFVESNDEENKYRVKSFLTSHLFAYYVETGTSTGKWEDRGSMVEFIFKVERDGVYIMNRKPNGELNMTDDGIIRKLDWTLINETYGTEVENVKFISFTDVYNNLTGPDAAAQRAHFFEKDEDKSTPTKTVYKLRTKDEAGEDTIKSIAFVSTIKQMSAVTKSNEDVLKTLYPQGGVSLTKLLEDTTGTMMIDNLDLFDDTSAFVSGFKAAIGDVYIDRLELWDNENNKLIAYDAMTSTRCLNPVDNAYTKTFSTMSYDEVKAITTPVNCSTDIFITEGSSTVTIPTFRLSNEKDYEVRIYTKYWDDSDVKVDPQVKEHHLEINNVAEYGSINIAKYLTGEDVDTMYISSGKNSTRGNIVDGESAKFEYSWGWEPGVGPKSEFVTAIGNITSTTLSDGYSNADTHKQSASKNIQPLIIPLKAVAEGDKMITGGTYTAKIGKRSSAINKYKIWDIISFAYTTGDGPDNRVWIDVKCYNNITSSWDWITCDRDNPECTDVRTPHVNSCYRVDMGGAGGATKYQDTCQAIAFVKRKAPDDVRTTTVVRWNSSGNRLDRLKTLAMTELAGDDINNIDDVVSVALEEFDASQLAYRKWYIEHDSSYNNFLDIYPEDNFYDLCIEETNTNYAVENLIVNPDKLMLNNITGEITFEGQYDIRRVSDTQPDRDVPVDIDITHPTVPNAIHCEPVIGSHACDWGGHQSEAYTSVMVSSPTSTFDDNAEANVSVTQCYKLVCTIDKTNINPGDELKVTVKINGGEPGPHQFTETTYEDNETSEYIATNTLEENVFRCDEEKCSSKNSWQLLFDFVYKYDSTVENYNSGQSTYFGWTDYEVAPNTKAAYTTANLIGPNASTSGQGNELRNPVDYLAFEGVDAISYQPLCTDYRNNNSECWRYEMNATHEIRYYQASLADTSVYTTIKTLESNPQGTVCNQATVRNDYGNVASGTPGVLGGASGRDHTYNNNSGINRSITSCHGYNEATNKNRNGGGQKCTAVIDWFGKSICDGRQVQFSESASSGIHPDDYITYAYFGTRSGANTTNASNTLGVSSFGYTLTDGAGTSKSQTTKTAKIVLGNTNTQGSENAGWSQDRSIEVCDNKAYMDITYSCRQYFAYGTESGSESYAERNNAGNWKCDAADSGDTTRKCDWYNPTMAPDKTIWWDNTGATCYRYHADYSCATYHEVSPNSSRINNSGNGRSGTCNWSVTVSPDITYEDWSPTEAHDSGSATSTSYKCHPYSCEPHDCNPYKCNCTKDDEGNETCDTCYKTCYNTCYDTCWTHPTASCSATAHCGQTVSHTSLPAGDGETVYAQCDSYGKEVDYGLIWSHEGWNAVERSYSSSCSVSKPSITFTRTQAASTDVSETIVHDATGNQNGITDNRAYISRSCSADDKANLDGYCYETYNDRGSLVTNDNRCISWHTENYKEIKYLTTATTPTKFQSRTFEDMRANLYQHRCSSNNCIRGDDYPNSYHLKTYTENFGSTVYISTERTSGAWVNADTLTDNQLPRSGEYVGIKVVAEYSTTRGQLPGEMPVLAGFYNNYHNIRTSVDGDLKEQITSAYQHFNYDNTFADYVATTDYGYCNVKVAEPYGCSMIPGPSYTIDKGAGSIAVNINGLQFTVGATNGTNGNTDHTWVQGNASNNWRTETTGAQGKCYYGPDDPFKWGTNKNVTVRQELQNGTNKSWTQQMDGKIFGSENDYTGAITISKNVVDETTGAVTKEIQTQRLMTGTGTCRATAGVLCTDYVVEWNLLPTVAVDGSTTNKIYLDVNSSYEDIIIDFTHSLFYGVGKYEQELLGNKTGGSFADHIVWGNPEKNGGKFFTPDGEIKPMCACKSYTFSTKGEVGWGTTEWTVD